MIPRVLIAEDEDRMRRVLELLLSNMEVEIESVQDGEDALKVLDEEGFDVVITDLKMPKMDGLQLLQKIKERNPGIPIILITAFGTIESAVYAMKEGAFDYITKPFEEETLKLAVKRALDMSRLYNENRYLRSELEANYGFHNLIGNSPQMMRALKMAGEVSQMDTTVLILGESGTGKELIAKAIHLNSKRSKGPFIAVNCAALPENLLESELFGYEKGAFSGAYRTKPGRIELASGGTLFLDEIAELPFLLQGKLLRFLQEKEFERLGGTRTLKAYTRVLCSTNRNLRQMVNEGRFREDLYYRINVFPITSPPLRERKEDIIPLAIYFLKQFSGKMGKKLPRLSKEAERVLLNYRWDGNVRELENVIERALILSEEDVVIPMHFPLEIQEKSRVRKGLTVGDFMNMKLPEQGISLEELEKSLILKALEKSRGNKTKAAALLNLSRATLRYRLKKLGLTN